MKKRLHFAPKEVIIENDYKYVSAFFARFTAKKRRRSFNAIRSEKMNSKKQFGKTVRNTAAALLCLAFAGTAAGCDSLIGTDNEADMSRVIAEVNITKEKDFAEGGKYAAYKDVVSESNGKIYKRDLISAFLSSGYSSVQNGATYKDTFNKLAETLVARKITVQYSMAYFLDADGY